MITGNNYRSINLEYINDMADGDPDFLVQIIGTYLTSIPADLSGLMRASADNNYKELGFFAHKLKGSFNFIGSEGPGNIFEQIEDICEQKDRLSEIPTLIIQVVGLANNVTTELNDVYEKAKNLLG